ncbi:MAG TPA: hypothetical protein PK807_05880 [Verrucomicrobiota bacterium]|nr:hypothetical protein [Verrucomicrobiota bacterium]
MKRRCVESLAELRARGVVGLNKAQMAGAIQISVRSLNGMIARGEISYWQIGKRIKRFNIEDAIQRMNKTVRVAAEEGEQ